jgi:hypothetical protein
VLSGGQRTGTDPLPRPLTPRVQEAFSAKVRVLPEDSRTLLLVAAADDTSDPAVVFRAATDLGVGPDDMEAIEHAGLASVEASLALTGFTRVTCDDAAGLAVGTAAVAGCRARGLVAWLPWALVNLSMTEAVAGRHSAAVVSATEGLRLARDLDLPMAVCGCKASLAWVAAVRGEEERCRRLADDAVRLAETHQLGAIAVFATWALGLLDLSLGQPEAAVRAGRPSDLADTVDW